MSPIASLNSRHNRRQVAGGALAASVAAAAAGTRTASGQEPAAHVQAVVSANQAATEAGIGVLREGGSAA